VAQAKQTADDTRKATATLMLWLAQAAWISRSTSSRPARTTGSEPASVTRSEKSRASPGTFLLAAARTSLDHFVGAGGDLIPLRAKTIDPTQHLNCSACQVALPSKKRRQRRCMRQRDLRFWHAAS
jgi:hypothetical protein